MDCHGHGQKLLKLVTPVPRRENKTSKEKGRAEHVTAVPCPSTHPHGHAKVIESCPPINHGCEKS